MAKALVIIDMQHEYFGIASKVVNQVYNLIQKFENNLIIDIRYKTPYSCVDALDSMIFDATQSQPNVIHLLKMDDDGSEEIHTELKKHSIDEVWICGVMTSLCVAATAEGLCNIGYKVVIVEDACGDHWTWLGKHQLEEWKRLGRFPITQVAYA